MVTKNEKGTIFKRSQEILSQSRISVIVFYLIVLSLYQQIASLNVVEKPCWTCLAPLEIFFKITGCLVLISFIALRTSAINEMLVFWVRMSFGEGGFPSFKTTLEKQLACVELKIISQVSYLAFFNILSMLMIFWILLKLV